MECYEIIVLTWKNFKDFEFGFLVLSLFSSVFKYFFFSFFEDPLISFSQEIPDFALSFTMFCKVYLLLYQGDIFSKF